MNLGKEMVDEKRVLVWYKAKKDMRLTDSANHMTL
jgi:hypothetical protein